MRTAPFAPIDCANPVNGSDPLNDRSTLKAWFLAVPGLAGGAKWPNLAGNLGDIANGGHATLTNGPTWAGGGRPGGFGAVSFAAASLQYATAGNPAALRPPLATVAGWVRPTGTGRMDWFGQWNGGADRRLVLLQGVTAGKFQFFASADGTTLLNSGVSATTVVAGTWYHVAGVADGTSLQLYVNGALEASSAGPASLWGSFGGTTRIGADDEGNYADGPTDDWRYYSRPLLASEVRAVHDSSRRGYPGRLNRVGRWRFAAAVAGVTYPQLERGVRGLNRGLATGVA